MFIISCLVSAERTDLCHQKIVFEDGSKVRAKEAYKQNHHIRTLREEHVYTCTNVYILSFMSKT